MIAGTVSIPHSLFCPALVLSPENSTISLKKGASLWGANITSPWCGIKRKANEHEMMLGNAVQKKLRGKRVENIFEGKMSFSCAASLHDLHLRGHSWPADFQEVTARNSIVNVEYVNSLKLTVGRKATFSIARKKLTCRYITQLFVIFHSIKMCPIYFLAQARPDKHSHVQTQKYMYFNFHLVIFYLTECHSSSVTNNDLK